MRAGRREEGCCHCNAQVYKSNIFMTFVLVQCTQTAFPYHHILPKRCTLLRGMPSSSHSHKRQATVVGNEKKISYYSFTHTTTRELYRLLCEAENFFSQNIK
ncbi:CLUMA_CG007884, isoform A [Clunio marinus]|uniref:CLUMA_CG007884, isoform A n=1 Tax=Clunio marinus TaxID=568069 RepID=A0A1J1I606_9DIPT|nr:CLUMA_CG007884, isoform A [Clunio marinus]